MPPGVTYADGRIGTDKMGKPIYPGGTGLTPGTQPFMPTPAQAAPMIQPIQPPQQTSQPIQSPGATTALSIQDFITEAQKLGSQQLSAQQKILNENLGDVTDAFVRKAYGQNVGVDSGIGRDILDRAITDQSRRLEPAAQQISAGLGEQALNQQYNQTNKLFDLVQSGQLVGSPADSILKKFGIEDPSKFLTNDDLALQQYATSKGLTIDQAAQIRSILGTTLQHDISLHPERYSGLAVDPAVALAQQLEIARAGAPGKPGLSVLCTELYRQGLLSSRIYTLDSIYGSRQHEVVIEGYHSFGIPIAKAMSRSKTLTRVLRPFILAWAYQMASKISPLPIKGNKWGSVIEFIGVPLCFVIGIVLRGGKRCRAAYQLF